MMINRDISNFRTGEVLILKGGSHIYPQSAFVSFNSTETYYPVSDPKEDLLRILLYFNNREVTGWDLFKFTDNEDGKSLHVGKKILAVLIPNIYLNLFSKDLSDYSIKWYCGETYPHLDDFNEEEKIKFFKDLIKHN